MPSARSFSGFTLIEILIGTTLLSVVFLGCIGVYMSALGFLRSSQGTDISLLPMVSLEKIAKRVGVAHTVVSPAAGVTSSDLTVRADYPAGTCDDFTTQTPLNSGDDRYWHYRFMANELRGKCDGSPVNSVAGSDTLLVSNVNTALANSSFLITNPSSAGAGTVVRVRITTTSPATELETSVALSRAK